MNFDPFALGPLSETYLSTPQISCARCATGIKTKLKYFVSKSLNNCVLVCPETFLCVSSYRKAQHTTFWNADHSYRCDSITKLYACLERNIPKRCFTKDLYVSLLREKYQLREVLTEICKRRREYSLGKCTNMTS